jgi:hypothetical protein
MRWCWVMGILYENLGIGNHPIFKGKLTMRIFLSILAVLIILVGVVWFLQGINVIGGSVMTGQSQWAIYGGIAFVAGVGLLAFANLRNSSASKKG